MNTRPKGTYQKPNTWLKSAIKNIQHPPELSGYTQGSSLLDLLSALSQAEQFGDSPLAYNQMEPRHYSCIHTGHLKQCQGTNIPGHRTLMVFAVTLAKPDSFGSGPAQGCPKIASTYLQDLHVTTALPKRPQEPAGFPRKQMCVKNPCFHIALVLQGLCPSRYPKFC